MARFAFDRGKKQTPESEWRSACVKFLKIRFAGHIWHIRTVGGLHQRSGIPDDIFVIKGVPIAIEFKAPNGRYKVTEKQQAEIDAFNRAGGRAGKVSTWEELNGLIDGIAPVQIGLLR